MQNVERSVCECKNSSVNTWALGVYLILSFFFFFFFFGGGGGVIFVSDDTAVLVVWRVRLVDWP